MGLSTKVTTVPWEGPKIYNAKRWIGFASEELEGSDGKSRDAGDSGKHPQARRILKGKRDEDNGREGVTTNGFSLTEQDN
ncbi:hypothetical protein RUM44_003661 [Polyplax serrata]|uniref:Uncharacterized protein n=1 Tax=Polyplax serrata TaxID=468196 RepID=A0ABR1AH91_POLSC